MIRISNYSSLIFRNYRNSNEESRYYQQVFQIDDLIVIQCQSDNPVTGRLLNTDTNVSSVITPHTFAIDGITVYDFELIPYVGNYIFILTENNITEYHSIPFCLLDEVEDSIKLTYSHRRNEFDTYFVNPDTLQTTLFDIRFKGQLQYRDYEMLVEDEQFRTQDYDPVLMSSSPYHNEILTIGDRDGVPVGMGIKVNLIFSLSHVLINQKPYVRVQGATPKIQSLADHNPLPIYTLAVTSGDYYDEVATQSDIVYYTDNNNNELTDNLGNNLIQN